MFTPFAFIKSATTATSFEPNQISDLVGWWEAGVSASVTGSDQLGSWGDQANTIGSFTKNLGTAGWIVNSGFGPNSMPYISGSDASRYISNATSWPSSSLSTVYVIGQWPSLTGQTYKRFMETPLDYNGGFTLLVNDAGMGMDIAFGSALTSNFTPTANTASVVRLVWNGTNNKVKLNNGIEVTTISGTVASQANTGLSLFNQYTNNNGLGFNVAEIIIYNKVLSGGEQTQITDYINTKYGIAS